jgi:rhodanese-related sulfurtransferase
MLDLSRGLRMDDRKQPTRDPVEPLPPDPPRESSLVVYCGNAQQVSEGFAIALRAMGIGADIVGADIGVAQFKPKQGG